MRLTAKLPAIVVGALLLTALAGSALAIAIGRYVLRQAALRDNVHNVNLYASAVRFYVENARSVLATTAELPQLRSLDRAREVAALVLTHSEVFENVSLRMPDGTLAMQEPRALETRLSHRDLSFSAWFGEVRRTGATVVSNLHISPATQRPTIVIATPVRAADGRMLAVWAGALRLEEFSKIGSVGAGPAAQNETGLVTDRRGLIIAHQTRGNYVENQTDFSTVPAVRSALAGESGSGEFIHPIENERQLVAYHPPARSGLGGGLFGAHCRRAGTAPGPHARHPGGVAGPGDAAGRGHVRLDPAHGRADCQSGRRRPDGRHG